jgi:hypothetical protein
MYDEWFDWALTGNNLKYYPAFRNTGGDDIGGGSYVGNYIFLMNDTWKGVPPDVDPVTVQVTGSFYGDNPLVTVMEMIAGNTTTLLIRNSALAIGIETGGGGGGATAAEVWTYTTRELTSGGVSAIQSGLAPAGEYDSELTAIQADLDNPNQYKADVSGLATQVSVDAIPTAEETADAVLDEEKGSHTGHLANLKNPTALLGPLII